MSASNSDIAQQARLRAIYGPNVYKCVRINCQCYSKGFASTTSRDRHIAKHERAFTCAEEGCLRATIGCVTAKELELHMKDEHGLLISVDVAFPEEEPDQNFVRGRIQKAPDKFQCSLCPKPFTRGFNLRQHFRTPTDERPFTCGACGKTFSRQTDLRRHERLHSGEKKYVCHGELKHGKYWGCGRSVGST